MKPAKIVLIAAVLAGFLMCIPGPAPAQGTGNEAAADVELVKKVPKTGFDFLMPGSHQPMNISAGKMEVKTFPNGKQAVYTDKVKVKQGKLTLTCDRLELIWKNEKRKSAKVRKPAGSALNLEGLSSLQSIVCKGNVKIVQGNRIAVSGKAVYNNRKRTITLSGGTSKVRPTLWQGKDRIIADTITIYIDDNRVSMSGGPKERINTVIFPGKQKEKSE